MEGEGGGSSLLYISIAYYRQQGGEEVTHIVCKNAHVINGRPLNVLLFGKLEKVLHINTLYCIVRVYLPTDIPTYSYLPTDVPTYLNTYIHVYL